MVWAFRWQGSAGDPLGGEMRSKWQSVLQRSPDACVFQELQMLEAWLVTKGAAVSATPRFCVAESTTGCTALLPFCEITSSWRSLWHRRLIGSGEPHFDYQDPLFSDRPRGGELAGFWVGLEDFLESSSIYDSAMLLRIRSSLGPSDASSDDSVEAPFVDMSRYPSWESYIQSRPANHRTDVKRRIRRLEELGTVRLRVLERGETLSEISAFISGLRTAYEDLWLGQPSQALFQQPGTWSFFELFVPRMLQSGLLHASTVEVDDRIVSWHVGFMHRKVLHWYKPTFLRSMEQFSPGKVHLALLLKLGFSEGWREFDFGCGTEAYKYRWADSRRPLVQWHWRSRRPSAVLKRRIRDGVKSVVRRSRD